MSRADTAKEYFVKGYTCSQATLLAFSDLIGTDGEVAQKFALPFGGGMGRLRLTCGAVSGAVAAIGLISGKAGVDPENKKEVYAAVREFAERFIERNGSLICGELLTGAGVRATTEITAEPRNEEYYKKRPCPDLVFSAAEILEEYLRERGIL